MGRSPGWADVPGPLPTALVGAWAEHAARARTIRQAVRMRVMVSPWVRLEYYRAMMKITDAKFEVIEGPTYPEPVRPKPWWKRIELRPGWLIAMALVAMGLH